MSVLPFFFTFFNRLNQRIETPTIDIHITVSPSLIRKLFRLIRCIRMCMRLFRMILRSQKKPLFHSSKLIFFIFLIYIFQVRRKKFRPFKQQPWNPIKVLHQLHTKLLASNMIAVPSRHLIRSLNHSSFIRQLKHNEINSR